MKNKPSKIKNNSNTVSSDLIRNRINLKELADNWRQFVHVAGGVYENDKVKILEMVLERKIIREGIKNKTLKGDIHKYDVTRCKLYWKSKDPPIILLSDGETVVPISNEFRQEEIVPMLRKIDHELGNQLEKVANAIEGNEFATIRITEFIRQNGRIIDDEEYERICDEDISYVHVFEIGGIYYEIKIEDFYEIFKNSGEPVSEGELKREKTEYNKALKCPLKKVPLYINSKYSTVQYVVNSRLERGK